MNVDYWTTENTNARWPKPSTIGVSYKHLLLRYNACYLKLRNITLGYNLPRAFSARYGIQSVRIYTTASNLWTLMDSQYKNDGGIDPDYRYDRLAYAANTIVYLGGKYNFPINRIIENEIKIDISLLTIPLILTMAFSSCQDKLEEENHEESLQEMMQTPDGFIMGLNSVYPVLRDLYGPKQGMHGLMK